MLARSNGHDRSLSTLTTVFLKNLAVKGFSESTVKNRKSSLERFNAWCAERGVFDATEVTRPVLERYQRALFDFRRQNGKPLSTKAQYGHLTSLRTFFKWLTKQNFLLANPASELELPKVEQSLPRQVLTSREVEAVMMQADIGTPIGIRDRAIMETLYSTGMRRSELTGLSIYDVDRVRETVLIRLGKGKKDRVVPIGERALLWLQKYLDEVRPQLAMSPDDGTLFLNARGESLDRDHLSEKIAKYVENAALGKKGSCHLFRHSMATLMLENGADIRFIQVMLGHSDLSTTEIYTRVSITKLKEVHAATHPGANLRRERAAEEPTADEVHAVLDEEAANDPE